MTEFSWRTRNETLARLEREAAEVLIIGGGITGAGLALDSAARGLKTALVEKRDFSAGTSSRSTKLIHGGLRYLEHFDFALVREGLKERALLLKLAPHLNEPFPFLIPIYQQSQRNYDHPLKMRAGLILYDLLSVGFSNGNSLGRHRRLSREEALEIAPQLDGRGLKGAFLYYDGRTNDARLVVEVIKSAHARGALIATYTRVVSLLKNSQGKISGARLQDELTGREFEMKARQVINATGVWLEEVLNLGAQASHVPDSEKARNEIDPASNEKQSGILPALPAVRPSKGIHLTVSADRLKVTTAWLIPALTGHRFYFVVPWEGRVNIGTTDTDYSGDKDAPRAEADEVSEILGAINSYFPEAQLEPADVISTWAGLRPLISDPLNGSKPESTTAVSRKEEIIETADGMISLAGGKLTTYRLMAERGIDLAAKRLKERFGINANSQGTDEIIIGGGKIDRNDIESLTRQLAREENLSPEITRHLLMTYGSQAQQVIEIAREDESLRENLIAGLPHLAAEIIYAARFEMALTITDVLARRTRLAMLAGTDSIACAARVAELMARETGWSENEKQRQVAAFTSEFEREYSIPATLQNNKARTQ